jgi:hypothetical protein
MTSKQGLIDNRKELPVSASEVRRSHADTRQSLNDPNYKGDDYMIDIELRKGPLTNRRCTDCLCLIIFSCVVGAMVGVGVYAVEHGDPARVLAPLDADANFCGIDYPDYPYLYYQ